MAGQRFEVTTNAPLSRLSCRARSVLRSRAPSISPYACARAICFRRNTETVSITAKEVTKTLRRFVFLSCFTLKRECIDGLDSITVPMFCECYLDSTASSFIRGVDRYRLRLILIEELCCDTTDCRVSLSTVSASCSVAVAM